MLLVLLYLMHNYGGFREALPVLGLYAFAGYRLMPALQTVYRELSQVRGSEAAVDAFAKELAALQPAIDAAERGNQRAIGRLSLGDGIELRDITYRYPNADGPALRNVSMVIPTRSTVGFVGSTGSGKTTAVDVILGLLRPQLGMFCVGGQEMNENSIRQWQRSLGYVPQQIYLVDDSVAANIAFGVPPEEIDYAAVEAAARVANLHEFASQLPEGYQTLVGENGVRLSGGQRQRIIIARALYHDPDVLILDEATSALDNLTEQAVMDAMQGIGRTKTMIMIAHRLSTVRQCDRIYLLEKGEVIAYGTYEELLASSSRFRAMAEMSGH
jgi:ABC-type multidrug transport system fused ATPase/permease subunit